MHKKTPLAAALAAPALTLAGAAHASISWNYDLQLAGQGGSESLSVITEGTRNADESVSIGGYLVTDVVIHSSSFFGAALVLRRRQRARPAAA
ncbi:MAG: hypothetical protein RLZZ584_3541 [Pseudomonadota bacterium]|jgi:hypothetical protein